MKKMKKLASIILATIMVLAMAMPVMAAETGKITINGTVAGKAYNLYKIFDLTYTGEGTGVKVSYTIDADWSDFFKGDGASYIVAENTGDLNPILVDGTIKYINITDSNAESFSQAALGYAGAKTEDKSVTATTTTTEVDGLALGYYLIYPVGASDKLDTYGCICSLTSTAPNGEVTIKATYPTITKTDDKESADVGGMVNYTITGKVPDTTGFTSYTYTIKDTMSDGLTFSAEDVTVKILKAESDTDKTLVKGTDYTYTKTANGFELTIKVKDLQTYVGKTIEVTYAAEVNKDAVTKIEKNSATLTYSNDPSNNTNTVTTPDIETVYSSKIVIDKYAKGDSENKLQGAEFILYKEKEGKKLYYLVDTTTGKVTWTETKAEATVKTTDEHGAASFDGLADGTYYLEEIKAPEGYNKLDGPVSVTVDGKSAIAEDLSALTVTKGIENRTGSLLPTTGGIGTTIFYVLGGILVTVAVVLLVTRKRMSAEK